MKSYLLDTNCLISFVIERIQSRTAAISARFESATNLECEIIVTPHVISEFVFVLTGVYDRPEQKVHKMIVDLKDTPGIRIDAPYRAETLLDLWPAKIKDYGDALTAMAARELGVPILTFDKHFIKQLKKEGIEYERP